MKQNTQQRLSDIRVLLEYTKDLINPDQYIERSITLEAIAKVTSEIQASLDTLEANTDEKQKQFVDEYAKQLTIASQNIIVQLELMKDGIQEATLSQRDIDRDIKAIYTQYVDSVKSLADKLQQKYQHDETMMNTINEALLSLAQTMIDLDAKLLSKIEMAELFSELHQKLDGMAESDRTFDKTTQNTLNVINGQLDTTGRLLTGISDSLEGIEGSFSEAVSRLTIVDVKVDAILRTLKEGDNNE